MPDTEAPKANPENLLTLIRDAHTGKVVIPEFQRSFIWAREDIEELLVSIFQGYFIGTFLMLDTPSDRPAFPFRLVEGLDKLKQRAATNSHATVRLALDGQQRITSLFYALYEPPVPLKYTKNPYRLFFRLDLALDGDPSDAVVGVSGADRGRLGEMQGLVGQHRAIPFSLMREAKQFYQWFYSEQKFLQSQAHRDLLESFYLRLERFMVPVIALSSETGKDNIVNILERINRTGVSLSLFDLAVARLYLKGVKLRELWDEFLRKQPGMAEVIRPEFLLKVVALWEGKEPRKSNLLDVIDALDKNQFTRQWKDAAGSIIDSYNRTTTTQGGYGAYERAWIPYTTIIVPLAVLLHAVSRRKGGEAMYRKVDQWYWASVFTQRYDSAVDTKTFQDVKEVTQWFDGGSPPAWLASLAIDSIRVDIDEPRSALYRGLMCLTVLRGARDFITGQPANFKECEDDHIFPRSKFSSHPMVNSILNRTLISSNRTKAAKVPSEFLPVFLEGHGGSKERLAETLESHFIDSDAVQAMESANSHALDRFLEARRRAFQVEIRKRVQSTG